MSYEGPDPPQLWRIEKSWDAKNKEQLVHLSLAHTYLPKTGDEFTMPSCFGGVNDELIVCGRKGEFEEKFIATVLITFYILSW